MRTADNMTRVGDRSPVPGPDAPIRECPLPSRRIPTSGVVELPGLEPRQALQTLAIDPGHGGDEVGVRGADGLEEKQLTLDVARRLRALVERGSACASS